MKNSIKLVVSDIDGTLLNERHRLSPETIQVVSAYVANGGLFAIATGRNHHDAEQVRRRVGVPAYLIASNGATVASPDGTIVSRVSLPEESVRAILQIPVPESVHRNLYQGTEWLVERKEEIFSEYYVEGDLLSRIVRFDDVLHRTTDKIFFTSEDVDSLLSLRDRIESEHGETVAVTFSMNRCLEVMSKRVNKGVALQAVAGRLGIRMDDVAVFGDGMNDLEMLAAAGTGFIMGNGNATLKERLPELEIVASHRDHGVARKIAELFEIPFPGGHQ